MAYFIKTGLLLLFIILITTCWPHRLRAAPSPSGREVVVYYSNDVHGETEPCG
jgi:hypothetical protein